MKKTKYTISQQIQRNLLAVISLVVAISALSYNTWRNETTEENRNIRQAAFEILIQLGKLQIITDHAYYGKNNTAGNPITGWGHVAMIEDLSYLMPEPLPEISANLKTSWKKNWEGLADNRLNAEEITASIQTLRVAVKSKLRKIE